MSLSNTMSGLGDLFQIQRPIRDLVDKRLRKIPPLAAADCKLLLAVFLTE
jgi:hypothetical protein